MQYLKHINIFLLYKLFFLLPTFAQSLPQKLALTFINDTTTLPNNFIPYTTQHSSHNACIQYLQNTLLQNLYTQGYVSTAIDTLFRSQTTDTLTTNATVYVGTKYNEIQLNIKKIPYALLQKIGYKINPQSNYLTLPFYKVPFLIDKILSNAENNGYPFAQIYLDSLQIQGANIQAILQYLPQKRITIDSVLIQSNDVKINKKYIYNFFNIHKNDFYNESKIQKISALTTQLPFATEIRPPHVVFIEKTAKINIFLKQQRSNQFDILLGLVQKNTSYSPTPNAAPKYELTGEGKLFLQNTFGQAETVGLQYKNYPSQGKELKVNAALPYIPFLPIGVDTKFELFIKDTLYRNLNTQVGVQYLLQGVNFLKAFVNQESSAILSIDSVALASQKKLPAILDVKNIFYGIEYNAEQVDYRLNPQKGWQLKATIAVGNKKVLPNTKIINVGKSLQTDFNTQYDSLNINALRYKIKIQAAKYTPIGKHNTLKIGVQAGFMPTKNTFQNEVYRIGGTQLLRGFNEQSIYTTQYAISTFEYRYSISTNSFFSAFSDVGYVQYTNNETLTRKYDLPIAFGIGANIETKAGIFAISYALGKQLNAPFSVKNGKVHIGYISYF